MPTMYEKQIMAGIDLDVDYRIDEIQRMYGRQEITKANTRNTTLEIMQESNELESSTYETVYGNSK